MEWQAAQDGLKAWFAAASGLHPTTIQWDGEAEAHRAFPQADLKLERQAAGGGTDERRHVEDDDGNLVPQVVGNRTMLWTITLKSRDQRSPSKAYEVLDEVRTKLELQWSIDAFDALEITARDSSVTRDIEKATEQRDLSVAMLSITLGYTVVVTDESHPTVAIESVEVGGTAQDGLTTITVPDKTLP